MNGTDVERLLRYHALMTRLHADPRFERHPGASTHDVLRLAQAMAWEGLCVPIPDGARWSQKFWERTAKHLGGESRVRWAIRDDAPGYAPPRPGPRWGRIPCGAPMIRREGTCGRNATTEFDAWNPEDGSGVVTGYCGEKRHREWGKAADAANRALARAGTLPSPVPNTGGLLPSYLPGFNWRKLYAWGLGRDDFTVPHAGLAADGWPTAEPVPALVLEVVQGERRRAAGELPGRAAGAVPRWLTAVPDGE